MRTRPARSDLVARVLGGRGASMDGGVIGRRNLEGPGPLVAAQRRLWILHQLDPESSGSNRPLGLTLIGPLDRSALTETLTELVRRHEALRTIFPSVDGEPVQVVQPPASVPLQVIDLQDSPPSERASQADQIAVSEAARPIDLARGPAVRAVLLRLSPERHLLLLLMHHIVFDGWSQSVLQRELAALYHAFSAGQASPLPELPIQPVDYAVWEQAELADGRLERHLRYWRERLEPLAPPLVLPGDFPEPAGLLASPGSPARFRIPSALSARLREWSRRERATPFMTLLSAFQVLLGRHAGQSEFLMAVPVAGRTRPEIEGLVGCFMNLMLIRAELSGEPSFRELVGRTRDQVLASFGYQEIPFERLMEELQPPRRPNRWPLFDVLFNLRNLPGPGPAAEGKLRIEPYSLPTRNIEGLALSLEVQDRPDGFECSLAYASNLFLPETVHRLCDTFVTLLDEAVEQPDRPVTVLPPISEAEHRTTESPETPHAPAQATPPPVAPQDTEIYVLPTSFAQRRLWLLDQMEPNSPSYNIPQAFELRGPLDAEALQQSFQALVDRHETLRTTIDAVDGMPVQRIAQRRTVAMELTDLTGRPTPERRDDARRIADEEASTPFDLARGPLFRVRLLRLGPEEHVLILVLHHIVGDGWSIGVLFSELSALYRGFRSGQRPTLPELPVQYADYAMWQEEWLRGEVLERELTYWRGRLAGAPALLQLPTDRPRPPVQSHRGARQQLALPLELARRLRELSRTEGATLYMTMLGAFAVLLQRYSGQSDLVIGSPIAGRTRTELEGLIGFFVNTLALRLDLSGAPSFRTLLGRVRETALGAYTHQELPFERLVEELQPARTLQHNPVVQVTFSVQNLPDATLQLPDVVATYCMVRPPVAKFDLACFVHQTPSSFRVELEYFTDLFDARTAHRMLRHYRALLAAIVADPDQPITALSFVEAGERKRVLTRWNRTGNPAPGGQCVHRVFEERAVVAPDVVAVESSGESLTYAELNARANRLARYLTRRGVGPETRVAVHLDRSADLIVALLGILKAGGAYVPLSLNDPPERLRLLLEDSAASHVLTRARCADGLPASAAAVLCLEDHADGIAREPGENLPARATPDNLVCVLYTSGSTGLPKGVGLSHGSAVGLVRDQQYLHFGPDEVFLHLAPTAFDASTFEIWGALLNGARLALAPCGVVPPEEIGRLLARHRVTTLFLTAGLLRLMVDERLADLGGLRQLVSGGDVLPAPQVARALQALPACRLFDAYGPTETTTIATVHPIAAADTLGAVPIGRPIGGARVYILDRNLEPSPISVPGELFIGGTGVARGYLGRPGQTAERFLPDPFEDREGARMYRTGDRARWRSDGVLEFLGRVDHQVKIRGFRIEPGEIEAVLGSHPGVRHSAVVVRRELDGDKRLAAFVVPMDSAVPEPEELRSFLKNRVPDYMVPPVIEMTDELPLTETGKIDRRVLAQRSLSTRQVPRRRPGTPTEETLASIWTQLLGRQDIGPDDDFFVLGGHSLLAVQVLSRVNRAFSVELPMSALFEASTLSRLAQRIDQSPRTTPVRPPPPLVAVPRRANS